jgi:recombinational DNA repair protein (RecF pathway)
VKKSDSLPTEGIIIRKNPSGDSGLVLKILTSNFGKISVFTRNARKSSKNTANNFDIFDHLYLELSFKPQGLKTLAFARPITSFPRLRESLKKIALASLFAECLDSLLPEDDQDQALDFYELSKNYLTELEELNYQKTQTDLKALLQKTYCVLSELAFRTGIREKENAPHGSKNKFIELLKLIEKQAEEKLRCKFMVIKMIDELLK